MKIEERFLNLDMVVNMSDLSPELKTKIFLQLKSEEGFSLTPYQDSKGYWTIGIGHKIPAGRIIPLEISENEAINIFWEDIYYVIEDLDRSLPWWRLLPEIQKRIIIDMVFNMGIGRFLGFKKMISALYDGDEEKAADEMKDSLWYRELEELKSSRAETLISWMRKGNDGVEIANV